MLAYERDCFSLFLYMAKPYSEMERSGIELKHCSGRARGAEALLRKSSEELKRSGIELKHCSGRVTKSVLTSL
jgi:hypothetical protein